MSERISTPPAQESGRREALEAEFKRGWRSAFAEVAISMGCDAGTLYKDELWYVKLAAHDARIRAEARIKTLEDVESWMAMSDMPATSRIAAELRHLAGSTEGT